MSLLPQFAPAPVQPDPTTTAPANGGSSSSGGGFDGLLASLAAPTAASKTGGAGDAQAAADQTSKPATAGNQLQQALSTLAGAPVNLNAPGLGLTSAQQQQLLAKLEKLLQASNEDGAQLLASLLAGSQLASLQAADLAPLAKLLGTSAQGTISVDALSSNLHLLTQAVQLVAGSNGQMTLLQAVQELTPPGDMFAQQLAAALAQSDKPAEAAAPTAVDTGPPQAASPGDTPGPDAGSQASATAGSNGHETTVAPTGEASPADGAVTEASGPEVTALAKAIEDLLASQPKAPAGQTSQTGAAASQASTAKGQPVDPSVQLAQMVPVATQAAAAQAKPATATTVAALTGNSQAPKADPAAAPAASSGTAGSTPAPVAATAVTIQGDSQGQAQSQGSGEQHTGASSAGGQAPVVPVAGVAVPAQGTFAAALQASGPASEAQPRPAIDQAVLDQVVQNATLALNNGQQEFRVQLKPDFLGAMEVRVSVDDGVVSVRMSVESAATRQLIDNNIGQLRQAFGTDQVRVEHVPNFGGSDAPWSSGYGGQQGAWQGQNPYNGSTPLPEAIPYTGDFQVPGSTAEPEAASVAAASSPTPVAPGAIDIQV